jgi:hypothetical protein
MFSVLQRRPALFPLPRCAVCGGTVTWRGRRVNILPAGIKGNQRQFQVPSSRFKVNGQGKTVSKAARRFGAARETGPVRLSSCGSAGGLFHASAACRYHSMGGHMGPPLRRRAERVSRRGSPTWLPVVLLPRVRRSPAPPRYPAAVPRVCFPGCRLPVPAVCCLC